MIIPGKPHIVAAYEVWHLNVLMAIELHIQCHMCKQRRIIEVPVDGFKDWLGGELIQKAMPGVSTIDREAIVTGTCEPCWQRMFTSSEDDTPEPPNPNEVI
jgi:hypothetical protein